MSIWNIIAIILDDNGLNLANNWDFTVLKGSLEHFVKPTHSGQTCIESRHHALYIWLSALKKILLYQVCLQFTMFLRSPCRSSNAQVRPYETVCVVFDRYIFKTHGTSSPIAPPGERQFRRPWSLSRFLWASFGLFDDFQNDFTALAFSVFGIMERLVQFSVFSRNYN